MVYRKLLNGSLDGQRRLARFEYLMLNMYDVN